MIRSVVVVVLAAACVDPSVEVCPDGAVCPSGTTCSLVTYSDGTPANYCAKPEQLGECVADGTACAAMAGTCHGSVCITTACGNRFSDLGEACDDGNETPKDGCAADCQSTEVCGNGFTDTTKGEACDDGNQLDHDGCTGTCKRETLSWRNINIPALYSPAMAYDEVRDRVVLFGGRAYSDSVTSTETWEWDGARWDLRDSPVRPAGRFAHRMAYDAERKEIVLFGGFNEIGSTWTLDATGWHLRMPTHPPQGRRDALMAYDAAAKRVIMYGGTGAGPFTDTSAWDGTDWFPVDTSGGSVPVDYLPQSMAFDATLGHVVLIAGDLVYDLVNDKWTMRAMVGGPQEPFIDPPQAAFDPVSGKILVVGGSDALGNQTTWRLDGTMWTRLADVPAAATLHALATDTLRQRVVLFTKTGTFEWDGSTWTQHATAGAPAMHPAEAFATDPHRHEILRFGGGVFLSSHFEDTWWWDGSWTEYTGVEPVPRLFPAMIYDGARDGIVMFGGADLNQNSLSDTWLWKDHTWTEQTSGAPPPGRHGAGIAYDGEHGRIVMFGGRNVTTAQSDTWTWDGTWHAMSPSTVPPPRVTPAMGYDPIRKRVVMFGGEAVSVLRNDTWEWDGASWTKIPLTFAPEGRSGGSLVWDASHRALVLAGGRPSTLALPASEIWTYNGAWTLVPTNSDPPPFEQATASTNGRGVLGMASSAGLAANNGSLDLIWQLFDGSGAPSEACTDIDTDGDGLAGCMDPDCYDRCTPTCPPMTSCPANSPGCGDGTCDRTLESAALCPGDCS